MSLPELATSCVTAIGTFPELKLVLELTVPSPSRQIEEHPGPQKLIFYWCRSRAYTIRATTDRQSPPIGQNILYDLTIRMS